MATNRLCYDWLLFCFYAKKLEKTILVKVNFNQLHCLQSSFLWQTCTISMENYPLYRKSLCKNNVKLFFKKHLTKALKRCMIIESKGSNQNHSPRKQSSFSKGEGGSDKESRCLKNLTFLKSSPISLGRRCAKPVFCVFCLVKFH